MTETGTETETETETEIGTKTETETETKTETETETKAKTETVAESCRLYCTVHRDRPTENFFRNETRQSFFFVRCTSSCKPA